MNIEDISKLPINCIVKAYHINNGKQIHLLVKCPDGVTRTHLIDLEIQTVEVNLTKMK